MTTEQEAQNPALREANRVLARITDSYFDGPLPTKGKADATEYVSSRILDAQTVVDPKFTEQEIETCEALLKEAEAGDWNPMAKEIKRIGVNFMNVNDKESARTALALFHLAFSITP